MNDLDRVALASVLHPVRHAAEGIIDQLWIAKDETCMPSPDEVLRALAVLRREVERAAGLVQILAAEQDA